VPFLLLAVGARRSRMESDSALIFRCPGGFGLGSALVSVSAYAGYCVRHGMTLALDMRQLPYYAKDAQAGFLDTIGLAAPRLRLIGDLGEIEALASRPDALALHRYQLLSFDQAPPAPVLDIDGVLNRRLAPWYAAKAPPGYAIALKGWLKSAVEARLAVHDWHDVVGVHHRHGNGEMLASREDFITAPDYPARARRAEETLIADVAARAAGRPVFVASDNREFVAQVLARVPGAFTLARDIPDIPILEYLSGRPELGLSEAAADMWALAACREVVCVSSGFTEAAALINPRLKVHVHDMLRLGRGGDVESAVHSARVHAFYRPDYPPVWRELAAALRRAGDSSGAADSEAIAQDVSSGALSGPALERCVRDVAKIGDAVARLKHSLCVGAHEANATRQFAQRLLSSGYADLAADLIEAVRPMQDGRLWALSALAYEKLDRLPQACAAARRAVDLLPDMPEARLILARVLKRSADPEADAVFVAAVRALKQKDAQNGAATLRTGPRNHKADMQ
jgi:Flp pilus assembly protein TadD